MDKKKKLALFGAFLSIIVALSKGFSTIGKTANLVDVLVILFAGVGIGVFVKNIIDKYKSVNL